MGDGIKMCLVILLYVIDLIYFTHFNSVGSHNVVLLITFLLKIEVIIA